MNHNFLNVAVLGCSSSGGAKTYFSSSSSSFSSSSSSIRSFHSLNNFKMKQNTLMMNNKCKQQQFVEQYFARRYYSSLHGKDNNNDQHSSRRRVANNTAHNAQHVHAKELKRYAKHLGHEEQLPILHKLGAHSIEDLSKLHEEDMTAAGIPLVAARQFLHSSPHVVHSSTSGGAIPPFLSPQDVIRKLSEKGILTAHLSYPQILLGGFMAGVYLSCGCCLMILAGGALPAGGLASLLCGFVFPVGLTLIMWCGADLLTGYMMYAFMPLLTENDWHDHVNGACKLWTATLVGNFVGSVCMALFAAAFIFPVATSGSATFVAALAAKKCSLSFGAAFLKALGANFLVCTAVYGGMAASTSGGKMLCIWLPIMSFVAFGLEHSIANMFLIPLGMHYNEAITLYDFFINNQIPVLSGNFAGAILFSWWMWFRHSTFKKTPVY